MILSGRTYFGLPYECYTHYYVVRAAHALMTEGWCRAAPRK